MKKYSYILFSLLVGLCLASCADTPMSRFEKLQEELAQTGDSVSAVCWKYNYAIFREFIPSEDFVKFNDTKDSIVVKFHGDGKEELITIANNGVFYPDLDWGAYRLKIMNLNDGCVSDITLNDSITTIGRWAFEGYPQNFSGFSADSTAIFLGEGAAQCLMPIMWAVDSLNYSPEKKIFIFNPDLYPNGPNHQDTKFRHLEYGFYLGYDYKYNFITEYDTQLNLLSSEVNVEFEHPQGGNDYITVSAEDVSNEEKIKYVICKNLGSTINDIKAKKISGQSSIPGFDNGYAQIFFLKIDMCSGREVDEGGIFFSDKKMKYFASGNGFSITSYDRNFEKLVENMNTFDILITAKVKNNAGSIEFYDAKLLGGFIHNPVLSDL